MTIDEAIRILTAFKENIDEDLIDTEYEAFGLGIEALKSVRTGRKVGLHYEAKLLPGETKE